FLISMEHNQAVGRFGETLAKKYLIKHGYSLVEANLKISFQEIDIIAKYQDLLVFVEVKTRTSLVFGEADEAMTYKKTSNFKKAITLYASSQKIDANNIRADLISVDINRDKKTAKIKHYQDIF
ncbi:YraN family protein, partial [Patescibacteria group bacterium]|nr:YraN family protein [Patescibacteria group bacterium]MBU2250407.1 YraN family protein [Patescibacteria group bacterium]